MAFKYEVQYTSQNCTPESEVYATWGRPRTIEAIAIHWWGDPNQGPSYDGVISTLCNPARGASAHLVATGTGRRVAQLVNFNDASWATNSANPYTVSIECDPRCRDEDYDVVAELIANIRSAYGDIPLVPHKQFVATACPGNYDLAELDRRARLKDGSGDWGVVTNKEDGSLIKKEDASSMRVINSEVKGWDRADTHSGNQDAQEIAAWVGQPWVKHIQQAWQEGAGYRELKDRWKAAFDKLPTVESDLSKTRDALIKSNEEKLALEQKVKDLQAEIDSKPTEEPSEPSQPGNGNDTTSEPTKPTQSISERLKAIWQEILKFINS